MKDKKQNPLDAMIASTQFVDPLAGAAAMMTLGGTMMQAQLEFISLLSRRARAQMELPRCAAGCQNLPELAALQKAYLQHAAGDYADCAQHLAEIWSDATPNLLAAVKQEAKAPASEMRADISQMTDAISGAMTDVIRRSFSEFEEMGKQAWGGKGMSAAPVASFHPWWLVETPGENRQQARASGRSNANLQRASAAGHGSASNGRAGTS